MKTTELQAGDRVRLPGGLIRTVSEVQPNGMIGTYGNPLFNVTYAEGHTAEWSHGNSAADTTDWVTVCSCEHNTDDHSYSHVQASSWCGTCGKWCDF